VPSALPGQAAGGLAGLGAAAGLQSNPQLLAQVMRTAQQQGGNPGQCESSRPQEIDADVLGVLVPLKCLENRRVVGEVLVTRRCSVGEARIGHGGSSFVFDFPVRGKLGAG